MRLLVAEDDGVSRHVLESMLCKWGHEVTTATDGHQAWQMMQECDAPDLLVLDWMMPGLDGINVCRKVRSLKKLIRPYIILLTGREGKQNLVTGINAGADDYVVKPFEPEELRVRIRAGERIVNLQIEALAAQEALREQATHDFLTGLRNRGSIIDKLQHELARSFRSQKPVAVVLVDLDHFKQVNDDYGHSVGDRVLTEAARRMTASMRPYEDIARYGGEEFLAVLSACTVTGAERMAERLRRMLADEPFQFGDLELWVTASAGVASSHQLTDPAPDTLIRLADDALYRAKRNGRNRVEAAEACVASDLIDLS
jgi:diguanylate cyclase (GGDEF)-like protein